jgi:hypothetical protein
MYRYIQINTMYMGISILAWLSLRDPHIGPRDDNQANMKMPVY